MADLSSSPVPEPRRPSSPADPQAALVQLMRFSQSLLQQQTLDDLLWHLATMVGEVFGFEDCVVYLLEPQGLVQWAAYGVKSVGLREIRNRIVLPLGSGIVGSAAASGCSERIADTRDDPRYIADEFAGRSELAVPIAYAGRVLGVLDSESSVPNGFSSADQATLELVAVLVAPRLATALAERGVQRVEAELQRIEARQRDSERRHHEERLESLGQLAGGIAHDFNNLLTSILGNVALARTEVTAPAVVEMLDDAAAACDRARGLTKQLLTFASGGAPIRALVDLGPLLRAAVMDAAAGTGLTVEFELPERGVYASVDREQVKQVARHLTRDAAEAQGAAGRLAVRARYLPCGEKRFVEVRWHDAGPGVPVELRGHIFDPYFTTKPEGTGLGLSTAFWIARRHGGSLELDPSVASGACFVLRLPAAAEPVVGPAVAERRVLAKLRILAMDDDAGVRQVIVRMLQSLGHEVVAVGDGIACVREFTVALNTGRPFDLALLDLTLPGGMDGCETLAALRQIVPGVPAIVVSGYHDNAALAAPQEHGFYARLEKPFTSIVLQNALAEAMAQQMTRRR